jgi:hypothetical protein
VIHLEILEDFDYGKWGTWENRFLLVGGRIKEPNVLVHVEDVFVGKALDVFLKRD